METKQIREILSKLEDYERRLTQLEGLPVAATAVSKIGKNHKQKTLREIVKGRKFNNGQEQIAIIVGYHEKILEKLVTKDQLKNEWTNAKIVNKFSSEFLSRAKDVLVRVHPDNKCDLTQGGEEFFDQFLKNESASSASK